MRSLRYAWAFLTRLPGGLHPGSDQGLGRAVPLFPVVGLILGLITGGLYTVSALGVDSIVAALGAIGVGAIITGGFHQDGLADFADSFGGYTRERRREIMHDSRVGTFGVLALVIGVGLQVAAVGSLGARDGFVALILAHVLGRSGAVGVMMVERGAGVDRAGESGLGAGYVKDIPTWTWGVLSVVLAVVAVLGSAALAAAGAAMVVGFAVAVVARRHLGAVTGDVLGAIEQCGEIATLIALSTLVPSTGWLW